MAWNIAGTALIARGLRAPGPTASYAAAALLAVLAVLLWWSRPHHRLLYIALSAGCGVLAALAVYQALTADPALWPSEFWRYAGIALNGAGALAALLAVAGALRR